MVVPSSAVLDVLAKFRGVEQEPAAEAVRTDPSALNEVVDGVSAAIAEELGGAIDVKQAIVATGKEDLGDTFGDEFELVGCEFERQGEGHVGHAASESSVVCLAGDGGWQMPDTRWP
jgi:hypothetical protein